jgi:hypothetical protein
MSVYMTAHSAPSIGYRTRHTALRARKKYFSKSGNEETHDSAVFFCYVHQSRATPQQKQHL